MNQDLIDYMNSVITTSENEILACGARKVELDVEIADQQTNIINLQAEEVNADNMVVTLNQEIVNCNAIIAILSV